MRLAKIGLPLTGLALLLASAVDARADLSIKIYEDGTSGTPVIYSTTGTSLTSSATPTSGSLGVAAPDYTISGLNASVMNMAAQGQIGLSATIVSKSSALHTLTILVSESSYVASGTSYSMASSSSFTYNGTSDPSSEYGFKSYATPGTALFGTSVASPGHTYGGVANGGLNPNYGSTGNPTSSGSSMEANTPFTSSTGYSLTEIYTYTSSVSGEAFSPTGLTIVTPSAVPEPASIFLLAIGAGSAGLVAARRRSRRRSGCLDRRAEADRAG